MFEYSRSVFFYETDKMGVVHHSNFVRWLEEARTEYFISVNLAHVETERLGVMSPVTDIDLKYKHPAHYGEKFTVKMQMIKYTGVRFRMKYSVVNEDNVVMLEGETGHAFIDNNFKPVSLARAIPVRHEVMKTLIEV